MITIFGCNFDAVSNINGQNSTLINIRAYMPLSPLLDVKLIGFIELFN